MTVAKEPESPESIHAVGIEMKVGADDANSLDLGLGDQESVKGIFVMNWQCFHSGCVGQRDRQQLESRSRESGGDVSAARFSEPQLASHGNRTSARPLPYKSERRPLSSGSWHRLPLQR